MLLLLDDDDDDRSKRGLRCGVLFCLKVPSIEVAVEVGYVAMMMDYSIGTSFDPFATADSFKIVCYYFANTSFKLSMLL